MESFACLSHIAHASGQNCSLADWFAAARHQWCEISGGVSDRTSPNCEGSFRNTQCCMFELSATSALPAPLRAAQHSITFLPGRDLDEPFPGSSPQRQHRSLQSPVGRAVCAAPGVRLCAHWTPAIESTTRESTEESRCRETTAARPETQPGGRTVSGCPPATAACARKSGVRNPCARIRSPRSRPGWGTSGWVEMPTGMA